MKNFLHHKIENYLLTEIKNRNLKPGMKISSERELAEKFDVSRMTVKYAIDKLVDSRILIKVQGKGTYVSNNLNYNGRIILSDDNPISIKHENIVLGKSSSDYVQKFKLLYKQNNLNKIFKKYYDFYELNRIRFADDSTYGVEYCYFPFDIFKDAIRYDFSKISIYDYMAYKKNLPINFITKIEVVKNPEISNILNIAPNDYIYKVRFFGFNKKRDLVEYTISYMKMDRVEFKINYKL